MANDRPSAIAPNFDATHDMWADGWGSAFALTNPGGGTFFFRPCTTTEVCTGDLRRNQFVGPNFFGADISLFKGFKVTERVNLQFRAEAFNLLNRTNFQLPSSASGGNFATRVNNGNFGTSNGTFNPRQIQLGLKLNF